MKTRWDNIKRNMKNWRWWVALPYMISFVVIFGGMYLIGTIIEWIGKKLQQPFDGNMNPVFARQVVEFIKRGYK